MANISPINGQEFLHSLIIHIPFPAPRLAKIALSSLAVDEELSQLVKRTFALVSPEEARGPDPNASVSSNDDVKSVLQVCYRATTPRMLRVAVNGFFESIAVVVQVMEDLDVDVLHQKGIEGLEGVQGVEEGVTGEVGGLAG